MPKYHVPEQLHIGTWHMDGIEGIKKKYGQDGTVLFILLEALQALRKFLV